MLTDSRPSTGVPELVLPVTNELGESPRWDQATGTLWWIDAVRGELNWFRPGTCAERGAMEIGGPLGGLVLTEDGGFLLAAGHRLEIVDSAARHRTLWVDLVEATKFADDARDFHDGSRLNDVVADSCGRVLTGTMREDGTGSHHLFSAEADRRRPDATNARVLAGDVRTSNGLAFSPDGTELYHADTAARRVLAYRYDASTGEVCDVRAAIRTAWPDGIAVDDDGRVWIAHWFGSKVTVWDPMTGRLLHTIAVPAGHVTACAFGGPTRSDLYVTTARTGLDAETLANKPATGGLFMIRTDARGVRLGRARVGSVGPGD